MASWNASCWARFSGKMTLRLNWSFHLKEHNNTVAWEFNSQNFCPFDRSKPTANTQTASTDCLHQTASSSQKCNFAAQLPEDPKTSMCLGGKKIVRNSLKVHINNSKQKHVKESRKKANMNNFERTKQWKKLIGSQQQGEEDMTKWFEDQTEHKQTRH